MANFFKVSKSKQVLGQKLNLTMQRLDNQGCGVSQYQGLPVFVEGALPHEKVVAKLVEKKSKYARASLIEVLQPSGQRIVPQCQHFNQCGGCNLQHLAYQEQIVFKQQKVESLFNRQHFSQALPWVDGIISAPYYYRRKARIGVQYNKKGDAIIGFRRKSTNALTPIKYCPVLVSELSGIFAPLKQLFSQLTLANAVGHIEVLATENITLVVRQILPLNESDKNTWLSFAEHNNWQVFIDDGKQLMPLSTCSELSYHLLDETVINFQSTDFIQINNDVNQQMIAQALQWLNLKSSDTVLDLFCGLGNFSLPIAKKVKKVIGVEGVQDMVNRAKENAKFNNITNAHFYQTNLNENWCEQTWEKGPYTKVLLDPARAGALEAIEQIVKLKPKLILYISCDPQTLARDAQLLVSSGYSLEKIMIIDMFSQTKHVETMVLFKVN